MSTATYKTWSDEVEITCPCGEIFGFALGQSSSVEECCPKCGIEYSAEWSCDIDVRQAGDLI